MRSFIRMYTKQQNLIDPAQPQPKKELQDENKTE